MTQECLDSHIIDIQCKFSDLSAGLSDALSVGSRKIVCLNRKNVSTAHLLRLLKCYTAFTSDVLYAYKIEFEKLEEGVVEVDMAIAANVFTTYIGDGTATTVAKHFQSQIDALASPVYSTELVGTGSKVVLYVYSYDALTSFTDITTVASNDTSLFTIGATNLQNNTDEILDLWNNITHEQLCKIIKFAGVQSNFDQLVTSSGCNC